MKFYVLAALCSFLLCFFLSLALIPLLRRLGAGQNILSYVKEHAAKSGTPTMGGIAFVLSACLVSVLFSREKDRLLLVVCAVGAAFMIVGFIDDFLKFRHRRNEGLTPRQKILFQFAVSLIVGVYCCKNGYTLVYFPFTGFAVDIGWYMLPLAAIAFVATVNCVNLTDGLDGLAAASSFSYFLCMGILVLLQGEFPSLSLISVALSGALAAYLIFNTNKASVFMGDTGSLSLGGFAASVAVFSGNILYILIVGFVFVLSGITVVLQVIYYKRTRKRIFLMAPVHHHFQQKGYSECKISYVYAILTMILGLLCILSVN